MLGDFRVFAPAKLNFGLRVLPRRNDGFHGIESIFQTVSLCDELHVRVTSEKNKCRVQCEAMVLPEHNTITATYDAYKELIAGDLPGVDVEIIKRIPSGGGLGGGSSDAASFLYALVKIIGKNLTTLDCDRVASKVGSDVFFFLRFPGGSSGAALVTGRGEVVKPVPLRKDLHFVLVFPGVSSSTAEAYGLVDQWQLRSDQFKYLAVDQLECVYNKPISEWNFVNSFTTVISARYAPVRQALSDVKASGAVFTDMTGSGSTVFGVYASKEDAERAAELLSKNWQVCVTT